MMQRRKKRKMTTIEIRIIAERIVEQMGGDAEEICNGGCADFAKRLVDQVGGQIVSNLSSDIEDELEGYEVIEPEYQISKPTAGNFWATSHCWVKVAGRYFDALNPEGVEEEYELQFMQNL